MLKYFKNPLQLASSYQKYIACNSPTYAFSSFNISNHDLLNKHRMQMKTYQYQSTLMKPPTKIEKLDPQEFLTYGTLKLFKNFDDVLSEIEIAVGQDPVEKNLASSTTNSPTGSWVRSPYGGMRIGRLLELLDTLGTAIAYRYAREKPGIGDVLMATACVDQFEIFQEKIGTEEDLYLAGYVCWVGRSSMEIRIDVSNTEDSKNLLASAYYVFVARSKSKGGSVQIPQLDYTCEPDQGCCDLRFQYGQKNQDLRKKQQSTSVFKVPPSLEEGVELHELFKKYQAIQKGTYKDKVEYIPIPDTKVEKTILLHRQDLNLHGKVFGGFTMREAAELAFNAAVLHSKGKGMPIFRHIDDFLFLNPVEVGKIAVFEASVTYVEDIMSNVVVNVGTTNSDKSDLIKTCELHITFAHTEGVPRVIPVSYHDGMLYLEGQRRYKNFVSM